MNTFFEKHGIIDTLYHVFAFLGESYEKAANGIKNVDSINTI